jgi:hypothetical protein
MGQFFLTNSKFDFREFFILFFKCQDLKKAIRDDPRYSKFSSSEKKCEKEFIAWLKDKTMKARDDYKQLLQVILSTTLDPVHPLMRIRHLFLI